MSGDEILSVSDELERLDVVLTDEIRKSSLGESDSGLDLKNGKDVGGVSSCYFQRRSVKKKATYLRSKIPSELLRDGIEFLLLLFDLVGLRLVGFGVRRYLGFEEGGSGRVDALRKGCRGRSQRHATLKSSKRIDELTLAKRRTSSV